MIIGTTRELKNHEYRVGITPGNVHSYLAAGHQVLVEAGAGLGSGFSDEEYAAQGATLLPTAEEVWARSEMLIKVKEPEPEEYRQSYWRIFLRCLHLGLPVFRGNQQTHIQVADRSQFV